MSGREEAWDGSIWLRSHLKDHADGNLTCPSNVQHCLRLDNLAVCDIRVSFTAAPDDELLTYSCGPTWADDVVLPGSSKPRRRRRDSREEPMRVAKMPDRLAAPQRRDLAVTTIVTSLTPRGKNDGPPEEGAQVRHQLILS